MMKFKVTQYVTSYEKVGDDYQYVDAEAKYECGNFDDLQYLISTLVEACITTVKFSVSKVEVDE